MKAKPYVKPMVGALTACTGGAAAQARSQVAAASDMFRSSRPANMHQPSGGVRAACSSLQAMQFVG